MNYTRNNTINEILSENWLIPYKGFFFEDCIDFSDNYLTMEDYCSKGISSDYIDVTIKSINTLREKYEMDPNYFIPIWDGVEGIDSKEVEDIVLMPFLIDKETPCYIVCAGGGYVCNALPHEGVEIALELNKLGLNAVVLTYRVAPNRYPKPQQDLIRAIQYIRINSERFHVKNNKIVIMGFSAAGHLCGSVSALYDQIAMPILSNNDTTNREDDIISKRPDAVILGYPVVSFVKEPHVGSADNLLGESADQEERRHLSVENLVTENYPPAFIWHCEDDDCVLPSNSIILAQTLEKHHVAHEIHLYPRGGHGCGLAIGLSAEGWIASAVSFVQKNLK